jgi:hypothetical protein
VGPAVARRAHQQRADHPPEDVEREPNSGISPRQLVTQANEALAAADDRPIQTVAGGIWLRG